MNNNNSLNDKERRELEYLRNSQKKEKQKQQKKESDRKEGLFYAFLFWAFSIFFAVFSTALRYHEETK
jgi:hypothetical protein